MVGIYSRLFHTDKATQGGSQTFNKHLIEACLPSEKLLAEPIHRKSYLYYIKKYSDAPEDHFTTLYEKLIHTTTTYLQSLPDAATLNTQHFSLLLDNALARMYYALVLRQYITLPSGASSEQIQKEYPLWTYVVSSSALLWNCGKLATQYNIALCNANGDINGKWDPLLGSLLEQTTHYKVTDINPKTHRRHELFAPLIARQIMPEAGLKWIMSNPVALDMWLAALNDESGTSGTVGLILSLINQLLEGKLPFNALIKQLEITSHEQAVLLQLDLEEVNQLLQQYRSDHKQTQGEGLTAHQDLAAGKEFLNWLRDGLANGSLSVNQANSLIHIGSDGAFLLYPQIFQDFCAAYPRFKDWIVVFKQFNALGLSKLSGGDLVFSKYFGDGAESSQRITTSYVNARKARGVVVGDTKALFTSGDVPAVNPQISNTPPAAKKGGDYPTLQQNVTMSPNLGKKS